MGRVMGILAATGGVLAVLGLSAFYSHAALAGSAVRFRLTLLREPIWSMLCRCTLRIHL